MKTSYEQFHKKTNQSCLDIGVSVENEVKARRKAPCLWRFRRSLKLNSKRNRYNWIGVADCLIFTKSSKVTKVRAYWLRMGFVVLSRTMVLVTL